MQLFCYKCFPSENKTFVILTGGYIVKYTSYLIMKIMDCEKSHELWRTLTRSIDSRLNFHRVHQRCAFWVFSIMRPNRNTTGVRYPWNPFQSGANGLSRIETSRGFAWIARCGRSNVFNSIFHESHFTLSIAAGIVSEIERG